MGPFGYAKNWFTLQNRCLPNAQISDQLGGAKYITTLDLTKYWQVPAVEEEDRSKTAFITPFGPFKFKRMPFGLQGAPATFQRMMDKLLNGCRSFANAYSLFSVLHGRIIWDIYQRFQGEFRSQIWLYQWNVNSEWHSADIWDMYSRRGRSEISKLEAIQNFPIPTTKKEVRSPITDLTRKLEPSKVKWSPACEIAFRKLKEALCSEPVL